MSSAALLETAPGRRGDLDLCLHIPRSAHTLAGFREWVHSDAFPDKLKVTYLRGEILLDMSKEEIRTHAAVKTEVSRVVANLNVEIDFGDFYVDGVLVTNAAAGVSNNPDGVAVLWESIEAGRVRYITHDDPERELEIDGSPDWLMEIVSDGSVSKDTQQLKLAYHRAKVGEYWLIDARGPQIQFQVFWWRKSGYVLAPNKDGWQRSRVFGRGFQLVRKRDRRGAWRYTLLVSEE